MAVSQFPVTRWTEVLQISREPDAAARLRALESLCRDYWYPLYAFARRLGHSQHDAEDLTQGFFRHLLEKDLLARASRELGKLRTFLLTVFQRYIGDERERAGALKRGGGVTFIPMDLVAAEGLYLHEPADGNTPERFFERAWALRVLSAALESLREAETKSGNARLFEVLRPFLDPESTGDPRTDQAAAELGMSAAGIRQAVGRLRRKFRLALRRQIAATLQEPSEADIDEELTALQAALG